MTGVLRQSGQIFTGASLRIGQALIDHCSFEQSQRDTTIDSDSGLPQSSTNGPCRFIEAHRSGPNTSPGGLRNRRSGDRVERPHLTLPRPARKKIRPNSNHDLHLRLPSVASRTRNNVIFRIRDFGSGLSSGNWIEPVDVLYPARSFLNALIADEVG